jgi:hypothetical protein
MKSLKLKIIGNNENFIVTASDLEKINNYR